jgi:glycosyltransferase involved in cell wall biosynthesis
LLSQTYDNIEIIIIDDGSTDNSGKICDEYALKDNRIKVIRKENGGLSSARNEGMKIAKGEYISFADSDDWIEPQTYQYVIDIMIKFNPDLIRWGFYHVNEKGKKIQKPIIFDSGFLEGRIKDDFIYNVISGNIENSVWCVLFKKEIIENYNLRTPEQIVQGEDLYLLVSYLLHCKSIYLFTDKYFYNYFQNPLSLSRKYTDKYINETIILIEEMSNLTAQYPLFEKSLSMRITKLIFYIILLIAKSEMSLTHKLQKIKLAMSHIEFIKQLKILKFTDYISVKVFPVFLAYKGYFRLSLYSIIFMNKAYIVYKYIRHKLNE